MGNVEEWIEAYLKNTDTGKHYETMSGIPLAPIYTSDGAIDPSNRDTSKNLKLSSDENLSGQYPFTRGPYESMYRSKMFTMRLFAGFGTALDTNRRFKELLNAGGSGLSTAFDLPTLMGRDSDDPQCLGEVGRCGVAVDTVEDMLDLYSGIDLNKVTTSMTINSPAAVILAMYVVAAQEMGASQSLLGGTLQNDILKEYQAQKEYFFPPRPSMRLVRDTVRYCQEKMPKFHPISISGYHIREAGATAAQELAFTLANGFAYVQLLVNDKVDVDSFAPRLSFFFNAHVDFFEEICKYRAARRIWARWMKDFFGAKDTKSMILKFHTQTAGVSLTAQQPEVNIVRTAIEALAGVLGGTQSLHTNSMDEVLALPSEKAARIALRTQQVIAYETGVTSVADPLGGSYYVEALTDEIEQQAEEIFKYLLELGDGSILEGVLTAIDESWFQRELGESAYIFEKKLANSERKIVGVTDFLEGNEDTLENILQISFETEKEQIKRLNSVKSKRDSLTVASALENVKAAAKDPNVNMMGAIETAVKARCTVGEIMNTMSEVFGTFEEVPYK